jgi:hypothetical protein
MDGATSFLSKWPCLPMPAVGQPVQRDLEARRAGPGGHGAAAIGVFGVRRAVHPTRQWPAAEVLRRAVPDQAPQPQESGPGQWQRQDHHDADRHGRPIGSSGRSADLMTASQIGLPPSCGRRRLAHGSARSRRASWNFELFGRAPARSFFWHKVPGVPQRDGHIVAACITLRPRGAPGSGSRWWCCLRARTR